MITIHEQCIYIEIVQYKMIYSIYTLRLKTFVLCIGNLPNTDIFTYRSTYLTGQMQLISTYIDHLLLLLYKVMVQKGVCPIKVAV